MTTTIDFSQIRIADTLGNATDPNKGAALVGYKLDAVDSVGRLQSDVNSDQISILDFSSVLPDGNGSGGGTDFTDAFQKSLTALFIRGGGTLHVPHRGTGIYRVDGNIVPGDYVRISVDPAVTIDFTNHTGGVNSSCVDIRGEFEGEEIPLGSNVTRGSQTITTATPHGLSVGDWFLLKGQRNSLSVDAGEEWRLGAPTGSIDAHACYFAEPCLVRAVNSSTSISVSRPIIFPDYRTDATQETSVWARPTTTLQKINFRKGVTWEGGRVTNGESSIFALNKAMGCSVTNVDGWMGSKTGALIRNTNGLYNKFSGVTARHSQIYYIDVDHSRYNSFKDYSSWWSEWDVTDHFGTQCYDATYEINGVCNIGLYVKMTSYDAHEQGITLHGGTYGYFIDSPKIIRARQSAITVRSRNGVIADPFIMGPHTTQLGAIQFTGWGVECSITGGLIDGYWCGVDIGPEQGGAINFPHPWRWDVTVDGTQIRRCGIGVRCTTHIDTPRPNAESSGIILRNLRIANPSSYGIQLAPYCNYVTVENIRFENLGAGVYGLSVDNNSVGHTIKDITGDNLDADGVLIRTLGITDTTTFPTAQYGDSRLRLGKYEVLGATTHQTVINFASINKVRTDGYTLSAIDSGQTINYNSASDGSFNIPFSGTIFGVGEVVTIVNRGEGVLNISAASGITLLAPDGPTLSQGDVGTLIKMSNTSWVLNK